MSSTSFNAVLRPPSPIPLANDAKLSCRLENLPPIVAAWSARPVAYAPPSSPNDLSELTSSSAEFDTESCVEPILAMNLPFSCLTLIPNSLSLSNSPVIASATASDNCSNDLPFAAAMLPNAFNDSVVVSIPILLRMMKEFATSSN